MWPALSDVEMAVLRDRRVDQRRIGWRAQTCSPGREDGEALMSMADGGLRGSGVVTTVGVDRYWSQPADELITALNSTAAGLATDDAVHRLQEFGPNVLKAGEQATPFEFFLGQFKSPIVLILLFATGVSAVLQEWVDAVIILLIVLGSALLSFSRNTAPTTPPKSCAPR